MEHETPFYNFNQLSKIASGSIPYLLHEYIPERSIGILVGEWGLGKSPFAIQLQLSLAAGRPFLDRYAPTGKLMKTLYVDLENGAQPVYSIASTISGFLSLTHPPENWYVYSPNYTGQRPDNMLQMSEEVYIRYLLSKDQFDFVIIDPLRMFNPDAESKNKEAAAMIGRMRQLIKKTGTTILFIHHPRKASPDQLIQYSLENQPTAWMAQACGAASLIQNADFRIGLQETEDGIICRRFLRNLGWFPCDYIERYFDDDDNPVGFTLSLGGAKLEAFEKAWLNDLPHNFTTGQFLLTCKKSRPAANRALKRMESLAVVEKVGKGIWQKIST